MEAYKNDVYNVLLENGYPERKAYEISKNEYFYIYNKKSLHEIAKAMYFEQTFSAGIIDDEMEEYGIEATYKALKDSNMFFQFPDGYYFEVADYYQFVE